MMYSPFSYELVMQLLGFNKKTLNRLKIRPTFVKEISIFTNGKIESWKIYFFIFKYVFPHWIESPIESIRLFSR